MKLENIGFYTLNDNRAATANHTTALSRCELVLTSRCNFKCPYCRQVGGKDMTYDEAAAVVYDWATQGLRNVRFSGGEPTIWPGIVALVRLARTLGISRVAISTNGSASTEVYQSLLDAGVNDFSISLDACCAEDGDKMAGGIKGAFEVVKANIKWLSERVYTTVGIVLTDDNIDTVNATIKFADDLGVSDIRVIPAAQKGDRLAELVVDKELLDKHKILNYRVTNIQQGRPVRGLHEGDSTRCGLVLDDIAVNHDKHYPCIIYMREQGEPIGTLGSDCREQRREWYHTHNTHCDPICKANCLDVCVDYNNRFEETNPIGI